MKEIIQTENFRRWESRLSDRRARTIIATRLFRLANDQAGDIQPIGEGISEIRIHYGPGYRLYFEQQGNAIVVLLCGGNKNSQQHDIMLAKQISRALKKAEACNDETHSV